MSLVRDGLATWGGIDTSASNWHGGHNSTSFIGRHRELSKLREILNGAARGIASNVVVEGEPGIGKTALVEHAARSVESDGFMVLRGAAEELEQTRPFATFMGVFRSAGADGKPTSSVARLLDEGDPGAQFRLVDSVVDLVESLTQRSPVALVLEDLHWADPSSLLALSSLARRLVYSRLAIVVTVRPTPSTPALGGVVDTLRRLGGTMLPLGPVDAHEVATLAAEIIGLPAGPRLLRMLRGAGGNPLFIKELIGSLLHDGLIEVRSDRADVGEISIPSTLQSAIVRRLGFLDSSTLELLRAAAILGSSFWVGDLTILTSRSAIDLSAPLEEAARAGIVGEHGGRLVFRHELIRDALYESMPLAVRRAMHVEAGRMLGRAEAPAVRVAAHFALGAAPGDPEAIAWLRRAATEASAAGPAVAAHLLERALALLDASDPDRDSIAADLVVALVSSGRPADAERVAGELLSRQPEGWIEAVARHALAQALFLLGRRAESAAEMQVAARHPDLDPRVRARFLSEAALGRLFGAGDIAGSRVEAREALELARADHDEIAEAMALCVLATAEGMLGDPLGAVALAEDAVRIAGPRAVPTWSNARMFLGSALIDADGLREADEVLRESLAIEEERGAVGWTHFHHYWIALSRFHAGELTEAVAEFETGLTIAEEHGSQGGALAAHALLGLVALRRDRIDQAERELESARRQLAETGPDFGMDWLMLLDALIAEDRGDAAGALATLAGAWDAIAVTGSVFHHRMLGPDLVRLAMTAGDTARAVSVTEAVEAASGKAAVASVATAAKRCRGLLSGSIDSLIEATEAARAAPRPVDLALCARDAATALGSAGRSAEARGLFAEAVELFDKTGDVREAARTRASMRRFGLRAGARGAAGKPGRGWASLSATELRVAALVAEGLSNPAIGRRLFISPRTVQTHLAHIFAKVGLSSRAELAAEAARRGDSRT